MEDIKLSGKTIPCPVCEKNTALEEAQEGITSYLCVSCGFTSNSTFVEGNAELQATPEAILKAKVRDEVRQIWWIPTVINMPTRGLIFPETHGKKIMWTYVPMVDIPVEEQSNYPIPNQEGEYYKKKLDSDSTQRFTQFYDALKEMGAVVELDELKENVKENIDGDN